MRITANEQWSGGAVGGPALKDRLFFFLNYEGRRDSQGTSVNAGTVPTANYRAGNLNYEASGTSGNDSVFTLTPADIQHMDPQGIGNSAALLQVLNAYPQGNDSTQGDGRHIFGALLRAMLRDPVPGSLIPNFHVVARV